MSSKKIRLSARLAALWPGLDKEKILAKILCGDVRHQGETLRDPSRLVPFDLPIDAEAPKYVSRGGYKLAAALESWNWSVQGKSIFDIGASTGGFTDALLQAGAAKVWAVDVGKGLLAASLVQDSRVVNFEGVGVRNLPPLDEPIHGAVADLSFRSLDTALPLILDRVLENWVIGLVKPQFEHARYGDPRSTFDGVVGDEEGKRILERLLSHLESLKITADKILPSPLRGRKGNQEYLVLFRSSTVI